MKSRLLFLAVLGLLVTIPGFSQFKGTGFSGGIGYGLTQAQTELKNGTRFIVRGFLRKGLNDNFGLELGVGSAKIGGDGFNTLMAPVDLRLNVSPFSFESWNPFLYAGYGFLYYQVEDKPVNYYPAADISDWTGFIPAGLGVQFKFLDKANFELFGGYNYTSSADLNAYREGTKRDAFWTVGADLSSTVFGGNYDSDGDGLSDDVEHQLGTDPKIADTDGDGLSDGDEVNKYKTDPKLADSDKDGLNDGDEVLKYHTDPNLADTDGDGLSDGDEILKYKTDPLKKDTDGDGLSDGDEVLKYHTDPLKVDTDGDGLSDGDEVLKYHTDPLKVDTDGGSVADGLEVQHGTNPLDPSDDIPKKVETKEEKVATMETGTTLALEGIVFETGSAKISGSSETTLASVVDALKNHPDVAVEVQGHTDNKGKEAFNKKLSQKRAEAVREYLVAHGIDGSRVTAKGYGSSKPIDSNDTDEGRQKNRRIEFLRTK